MAARATVYKIELQIADMDRDYYQTHNQTLALHPSETLQRMMMRVVAFGFHASDRMAHGRGISTDNEPDLWEVNRDDSIAVWIDLGQPDEKRIRRGCTRAAQSIVYTYGDQAPKVWWEQVRTKLTRFNNLSVFYLPESDDVTLDALVERSMRLSCTIQDGQMWLANGNASVLVDPERWYPESQ